MSNVRPEPARRLGGRRAVPSPAIAALAERVKEEARRLARLARNSTDVDLDRLWRRLAMWSATLSDMAVSGPASHDAALRAFEEHPDHARAGGDPMIDHKALADAVAFLAVGDMVLSAVASVFMGRWGVEYRDDNPWADLMAAVDEHSASGGTGRLVAASRELDLNLRDARHRITAHRRRSHAEVLEWDDDDALTIVLTNPDLVQIDPALLMELGISLPREIDPEGRVELAEQVVHNLRASYARLQDSHAATGRPLPAQRAYSEVEVRVEINDLFDLLHRYAGLLDSEGRRLVREAHKIAGFESVRPSVVVDSLLRATAEITTAHGPEMTDWN